MTTRDLTQFNAHLTRLIRPMPHAKYQADHGFSDLENGLKSLNDWGLNLEPDFQRGHVWTQEQQERFVEAILRGQIAESGLTIQFNAPHWENDDYEGDLPREVQCVDGLQRLTAVRRFMANEIKAYGYTASELAGTNFSPKRLCFRLKFAVHEIQTRAELLQYYLDLNAGGTPHSSMEIDRVRQMLHEALPTHSQEADDAPAPAL